MMYNWSAFQLGVLCSIFREGTFSFFPKLSGLITFFQLQRRNKSLVTFKLHAQMEPIELPLKVESFTLSKRHFSELVGVRGSNPQFSEENLTYWFLIYPKFSLLGAVLI